MLRAGRHRRGARSRARSAGRRRATRSPARRSACATGLLSVKEVEIPFARVQAVDVEQGPIQRLFGVHRVDVQTGGGGAGGEIVLGAVDDARGRAHPRAARRARPRPRREAARRRSGGCRGRAARAGGGHLGPARRARAGRRGRRADVPAALRRPDRGRARRSSARCPTARSAGCCWRPGCSCSRGCWPRSARWSRSAASPCAGRATTCGSAAGCSSAARSTLRVARVRAVRVIESVPRQPLGLAALRVEVIGHAKEQAAAQTLFPLLRRGRRSSRSCASCCPSWPTRSTASPPPPRARAAPLRAAAARGDRDPRRRRRALALGSPWPLAARAARRAPTARSASAPPAGGWRAAGSRSARAGSRAPPCSPRPPAASPTSSTRPRSSAARGSPTSPSRSARAPSARIRHLDADVARALWAAIGPKIGSSSRCAAAGAPVPSRS